MSNFLILTLTALYTIGSILSYLRFTASLKEEIADVLLINQRKILNAYIIFVLLSWVGFISGIIMFFYFREKKFI